MTRRMPWGEEEEEGSSSSSSSSGGDSGDDEDICWVEGGSEQGGELSVVVGG